MTRLLALLTTLALAVPAAAAVVAPRLEALLADGPRPVWVFFADKGAQADDPGVLAAAADRLSERALQRRLRRGADGPAVRWTDLPNDPAYLAWLRAQGFTIRAESRWLAAVSVVASRDDLARLAGAPFVARLAPVRPSAPRDVALRPAPAAPGVRRDPLDYGGSLPELAQVNVPAVHELGYHGEGVLVGMLDSGFDTAHEALAGLDVRGTWDFVNDDAGVADEPGEEGAENHGTMTLSTLGGHAPGSLVGPAFGASFYLAKTEDVFQEVPAEEDFWVEGLEWLEANGCDLVSSSLCYQDWYVFEDYDGDTCVTTVAADLAAALGVAVFNSAGNYRWSTGHIAAPADGDSVVAVGAVELSGEIAGFSSPGPTADGRIKPDVCALGVGNHVVLPGSLDEYTGASGTSFACPLTAGVGALLLGAFPDADPWQLRDALRETASQADAPDNDFGWGIVDALAALNHLGATAAPEAPPASGALRLRGARPNPFNPATVLTFAVARPMTVTLDVLDVRGRQVRRLACGALPAGEHQARWDGRDDAGAPVAGGVYLARLTGGGTAALAKLVLVK